MARIRFRAASDEPLTDRGLTFILAIFGLATPVWLAATVALVWRQRDLEPGLTFLAVFAGSFLVASLVYGLGYLIWLAFERPLAAGLRKGLGSRLARATPALLGISAVAGLLLLLAASAPLVSVGEHLTALPAEGRSGSVWFFQEYQHEDTVSARTALPLIAETRAATETRGFGRPFTQPQPSVPLIANPVTPIPIDPVAAFGILAVVESLIALTRRRRIGLTGYALALTGLAGLGYLLTIGYWFVGLSRIPLDAESFIVNSPANRLSFELLTHWGYWVILLLSLTLLIAGLLLNVPRPTSRP